MHTRENLAKRVKLRKSPLIMLIINEFMFDIVSRNKRWVTHNDYLEMVSRFYRVLVPDFHGGLSPPSPPYLQLSGL